MDTRVKPAYDGVHRTPSRIYRLSLTHFRNYRAAKRADAGRCRGAGGAEWRRQDQLPRGDLVSPPGRGLRRATLEDVADNQGEGSWAVSAEVEGALGLATLGTGIDPPAA